MGVKDLWTILSPTSERKSLYDLQGKTVAVDLSCWVVEDQSVATYSSQPRMYLRNLFFRTTCLLMLNVKPVFVLEGDAPTLKHDTMARRKDAQQKIHIKHHGSSQTQQTQSQNVARKGTRSRLKSLLKQCQSMLREMGVTCVQSAGEAEALCAQLNASGLVEGCITQDGDCFLYGARKVYRNFTISTAGSSSSSGFSVDVFDSERVKRQLSLGRRKLVALALLLGCDYAPGVNGVGKVAALAFLDSVTEDDVLDRMKRWRTDDYFERLENDRSELAFMTPEEKKSIITELNIRKKALEDPEFPSQEVIAEFLTETKVPPKLDMDWHEPSLPRFVVLAVKQLGWTETYAVEKFFPLISRWHVTHPSRGVTFSPTEITKKRVLKGVASYQLRWVDHEGFLNTLDLDEDKPVQDVLVSVEPQVLVDNAFPLLVDTYQAMLAAKKQAKKKPTRKAKENASSQSKMDAFLKPIEFDEATTEATDREKAQRNVRVAAKKCVKKPQVTIASLMRQMAAIKRCKTGTSASSPLRNASKSASSPLRRKPSKFSVSSPRLSPISNCLKRVSSPHLKVGFKTRRISTPGKRVSIHDLEQSFKNVSIADYSEDDGEFSDISAIIDGIVGVSKCETEYPPNRNVVDEKCGAKVEPCVSVPNHVRETDVDSDDEFDFCNMKIVPLHVKLASQI